MRFVGATTGLTARRPGQDVLTTNITAGVTMKVTPEDLCGLADTCLAESQAINKGWGGQAGALQVDSSAAGNSSGGPAFVAAHTTTLDAGDVAIGRLAAVLEADMDDLYTCAFDISAQDEESARVSRATGAEVSSIPWIRAWLGVE